MQRLHNESNKPGALWVEHDPGALWVEQHKRLGPILDA